MVCFTPLCIVFGLINFNSPTSFYCIVLLTALFLSTCYWPPVPIETPLTIPWAENITTYADALLSLMPDLPKDMIPSDIPTADHCWCDLTSGKFFEPFDMMHWELESVVRVKEELEFQQRLQAATDVEAKEDTAEVEGEVHGQTELLGLNDNSTSTSVNNASSSTASKWPSIFGTIWPFLQAPVQRPPVPEQHVISETPESNAVEPTATSSETVEPVSSTSVAPVSTTPLPRFRREYDLRQYGFEMVVDFGWTRQKS